MGNNDTKLSPVNILNRSYDPSLDVLLVEIIGQDGVLKNPATEETLANITTPSDNQNVELINALRVLTLAIANPSYVDKSANVIRNQIQSGTVTTVGTVTNMGVWPGGQLSFTASQNTWANMCRSLIT